MKLVCITEKMTLKVVGCIILAALGSCDDVGNTINTVDTFSSTLDVHLSAIGNRNLDDLTPTVGDSVIMIGPDGDMLQSKDKFIDFHKTWFSQTNWEWSYQILRKKSTDSLGYALVQYTFTQRDSRDSVQFADEAYLILIFKNSNEGWQLVHDQNTRLKRH